jgi:hypothetical protein
LEEDDLIKIKKGDWLWVDARILKGTLYLLDDVEFGQK